MDTVPIDPPVKFTYNLTQNYLEVARAALAPIHGKIPAGSETPPPSSALASAIFSVMSLTIVYSFLALESFLNSQLYRLWERRHDGSPEGNRFLAALGDEPDFVRLKTNSAVREVPERLKTLCKLLAYRPPHEAIPRTWNQLHQLVEASRHFVIHPYPDQEYFSKNMRRILLETESGAYVRVVEEVLTFLYQSSAKPVPSWVTKNELLEIERIKLLPVQG